MALKDVRIEINGSEYQLYPYGKKEGQLVSYTVEIKSKVKVKIVYNSDKAQTIQLRVTGAKIDRRYEVNVNPGDNTFEYTYSFSDMIYPDKRTSIGVAAYVLKEGRYRYESPFFSAQFVPKIPPKPPVVEITKVESTTKLLTTQSLQVVVYMRNPGTEVARDTLILDILRDGQVVKTQTKSVEIKSLDSDIVLFERIRLPAGTYTARVTVKGTGQSKSVQFEVREPWADIRINSLTPEKEQYSPGERIRLVAEIQNYGTKPGRKKFNVSVDGHLDHTIEVTVAEGHILRQPISVRISQTGRHKICIDSVCATVYVGVAPTAAPTPTPLREIPATIRDSIAKAFAVLLDAYTTIEELKRRIQKCESAGLTDDANTLRTNLRGLELSSDWLLRDLNSLIATIGNAYNISVPTVELSGLEELSRKWNEIYAVIKVKGWAELNVTPISDTRINSVNNDIAKAKNALATITCVKEVTAPAPTAEAPTAPAPGERIVGEYKPTITIEDIYVKMVKGSYVVYAKVGNLELPIAYTNRRLTAIIPIPATDSLQMIGYDVSKITDLQQYTSLYNYFLNIRTIIQDDLVKIKGATLVGIKFDGEVRPFRASKVQYFLEQLQDRLLIDLVPPEEFRPGLVEVTRPPRRYVPIEVERPAVIGLPPTVKAPTPTAPTAPTPTAPAPAPAPTVTKKEMPAEISGSISDAFSVLNEAKTYLDQLKQRLAKCREAGAPSSDINTVQTAIYNLRSSSSSLLNEVYSVMSTMGKAYGVYVPMVTDLTRLSALENAWNSLYSTISTKGWLDTVAVSPVSSTKISAVQADISYAKSVLDTVKCVVEVMAKEVVTSLPEVDDYLSRAISALHSANAMLGQLQDRLTKCRSAGASSRDIDKIQFAISRLSASTQQLMNRLNNIIGALANATGQPSITVTDLDMVDQYRDVYKRISSVVVSKGIPVDVATSIKNMLWGSTIQAVINDVNYAQTVLDSVTCELLRRLPSEMEENIDTAVSLLEQAQDLIPKLINRIEVCKQYNVDTSTAERIRDRAISARNAVASQLYNIISYLANQLSAMGVRITMPRNWAEFDKIISAWTDIKNAISRTGIRQITVYKVPETYLSNLSFQLAEVKNALEVMQCPPPTIPTPTIPTPTMPTLQPSRCELYLYKPPNSFRLYAVVRVLGRAGTSPEVPLKGATVKVYWSVCPKILGGCATTISDLRRKGRVSSSKTTNELGLAMFKLEDYFSLTTHDVYAFAEASYGGAVTQSPVVKGGGSLPTEIMQLVTKAGFRFY